MILDDVPILHYYKLNHLLYADDLLLITYPYLAQVCKTISIEFLTFVKSEALKSVQINQKLWYFQKEVEKLKTSLNL